MRKRWVVSSLVPARNASKLVLHGGRGTSLMMYYAYVIRSKKDKKLYIGYCQDLKKRIKEHNSGKVFATKARIPFEIVYYEAGISKEKAIKREKYFKTGFGRRFLINRI